MINFNNDYYFDPENNNFEIINTDIDNIININNKLINDYNIEFYDNIIRVKCAFFVLILMVNYFYLFINNIQINDGIDNIRINGGIDNIQINGGIDDID